MVIKLDGVYSIESDTYTYNLKQKWTKEDLKGWIAAIKEIQDELRQMCKALTKEHKNAGA